jgi:hypothetical protein
MLANLSRGEDPGSPGTATAIQYIIPFVYGLPDQDASAFSIRGERDERMLRIVAFCDPPIDAFQCFRTQCCTHTSSPFRGKAGAALRRSNRESGVRPGPNTRSQ